MLDAKELADLLYADGLKKDDIDLQEMSNALFLKAMFSKKVLSRIWIDAMCDATSEQENKLFEDFNRAVVNIDRLKDCDSDSWAMTLSNSITLTQARIGCLVIKLLKQACENHVKENGKEVLEEALSYVDDMENERDYP
tara:strand:- start:199 stop:615 length:417 start_codon:yes stop_codon:yes gene_type:complete